MVNLTERVGEVSLIYNIMLREAGGGGDGTRLKNYRDVGAARYRVAGTNRARFNSPAQ